MRAQLTMVAQSGRGEHLVVSRPCPGPMHSAVVRQLAVWAQIPLFLKYGMSVTVMYGVDPPIYLTPERVMSVRQGGELR
jgi:hypothetical protein